jgi:maltose alpha-D-glucosyltransferase/alpha-amylase
MKHSLKNARRPRRVQPGLPPDRTWYRTAVIYEAHVRAFADSDGDGIGDFPGSPQARLPQDLGVTALWLLPFYPSPLPRRRLRYRRLRRHQPRLRHDGRLPRFLDEAHLRGHPRHHRAGHQPHLVGARLVPARAGAPAGSPERDFYVWSDTPSATPRRASSSRTSRPRTGRGNRWPRPIYWHRFYSHQPILNFDNPAVHRAVEAVLDFWLAWASTGCARRRSLPLRA